MKESSHLLQIIKTLLLCMIVFIAVPRVCLAAAYDVQVQQAQEALLEAGFNPGPGDGLMGKKTRAALRQFQTKEGLSVTGELDTVTLKTLLDARKPAMTDPANMQQIESEKNSDFVVTGEQATQTGDPELNDPDSILLEIGSGFSDSDWIRLAALLVLGLGVFGIGGWIIASVFGIGAAYFLHAYVEWGWSLSILLGLAVIYVLPVLIVMIWKSIGNLITVVLVIGIPTLLVSHYVLSSDWLWSVAYSAVLAILVPLAITRILTVLGVINREEVTRPSATDTTSGKMPYQYVTSNSPSQSSSSPITPR